MAKTSQAVKEIDARGLSCPQPVYMTIKAIDEGKFPIQVTVDNATAKANIRRLAQGKKLNINIEEKGEDIILTLSK
ncbi:MAG: sulfurtransferase TusA family protein [Anaerolineaceae bacterium]|nr:sulfurtransferase TusA family protein [Anaerolineaceae bacterium]